MTLTLEMLPWIYLAPFAAAAIAILVPVGIHDWKNYHPNDWGR